MDRLSRGEWDDATAFRQRLSRLASGPDDGHGRLLATEGLAITLYPHQRRAVAAVLEVMRGRAILADEVGLGKTIEAGVLLREYWLRGLVRDALVLVPASLVRQWRGELRDRLRLPIHIADRPEVLAAGGLLLASLDRVRQAAHQRAVAARPWDMIIVDEAHRLKNPRTRSFSLVHEAEKRFLLLVTATPVQNDLRELYTLITLVRPGQLSTYAAFKREFAIDPRRPKNVERLRRLLAEVVVRSSRREVQIRLPERRVRAHPIEPAAEERSLHDAIWEVARAAWRRAKGRANPLPFVLLLREACSHPEAVARTLTRMARGGDSAATRLLNQAEVAALRALPLPKTPSKVAALIELVAALSEPVIVFTEFRSTQRALISALCRAGHAAIPFHGGLSAPAKEAAIRRFWESGGVLVSTEAGAEGRNLQCCRVVINYDLPWNPLRIEQRIGRVHRLGQERPVYVFNLWLKGTVEAHVVTLLMEKIRLFERVVGDLEAIVDDLAQGRRFEAELARAFLTHREKGALAARLRALEEEITRRVEAYEAAERAMAALFDGDGSAGS
ncbi:MAG TPA: SNF2-related protein [Limnochordia bacterium]